MFPFAVGSGSSRTRVIVVVVVVVVIVLVLVVVIVVVLVVVLVVGFVVVLVVVFVVVLVDVLALVLVAVLVDALFFCHFSSSRPSGMREAIESGHRALGATVGAVWRSVGLLPTKFTHAPPCASSPPPRVFARRGHPSVIFTCNLKNGQIVALGHCPTWGFATQ